MGLPDPQSGGCGLGWITSTDERKGRAMVTVFWAAVIACTLGTVACFIVGMCAHVRDQQIPRQVTTDAARRIMSERNGR